MAIVWTTAQRDTLQAAIASGTKRVEFGPDHVVMYQDTEAMLAVLAEIDSYLSSASVPRHSRVAFSRE